MQLLSTFRASKKLVSLMILMSHFLLPIAVAQEVKIVTFGDSIAAGLKRDAQGTITCPEGVSVEPGRFNNDTRLVCYGNGVLNQGGYQTNLSEMIAAMGFTPSVANYGFSGATTADMLSLKNSVLSASPDSQYVMIYGGANDAAMSISTSTVISNIAALVNDVRNRGMIPVITTTTRNTRDSISDLKTQQYAEGLREYASDNNVLLADARLTMEPWNDFHSGDGLHLGGAGDQALAELYLLAIGLETQPTDSPKAVILAPLIMLLLDDVSE